MQQIGVRELISRASELLREVRDHKASYEVTQRGKVVARLVPAGEQLSPDEWLAEWDALVEEIARHDTDPRSTVELVREGSSIRNPQRTTAA